MDRFLNTVLNLALPDMEAGCFFYKAILSFIEIARDDNKSQVLLYNPRLSKNLFIRISEFKLKQFVKPSAEHLIVFYLNDAIRYQTLTRKIIDAGIKEVASSNPYWDEVAKTFIGPGEYRIVLHPGSYQGYKVRIAKPTSSIAAVIEFYINTLNLIKLGEFFDHASFDGVMFAAVGQDCHLEMTYQQGYRPEKNPSGYAIELDTQCIDKDELKVLIDPDDYKILIHSKPLFKAINSNYKN